MSFYKHEADKKSGDGLALTEWNDLSNAVAGNSGLTLALTVTDKIGIGTSNPTHKFHVNGNAQIQNAFVGDVGHGKTWAGFAHSERANQVDYGLITHKDGTHTLVNKKNTGNGFIGFRVGNSDKMVITNDGNVGIGTENPDAKLTIVPASNDRGLEVLSPTSGSTHFPWTNNWNYISGMGVIFRNTANQEKMRLDSTSGNLGIGTTNPAQKLHVEGVSFLNGNVGIGTSNPTKGQLEIAGWTSYQFAVKGGVGTVGSNNDYGTWGPQPKAGYGSSIYTPGKILAHSFLVPSDLRTKELSGKSDSKNDLETINKIEIVDYKMKDVIAKGDSSYKKVIAQQVKEVFPLAISKSTDAVPDIYEPAHLEDGWINLETDLKTGEKVQLIFGTEKIVSDVIEIGENKFKVSSKRQGDVFVYGREVDDFLSVDYEAISMLNVSATRELSKQVDRLKKENAELKVKIKHMEKRESANQKALEIIFKKLEVTEMH